MQVADRWHLLLTTRPTIGRWLEEAAKVVNLGRRSCVILHSRRGARTDSDAIAAFDAWLPKVHGCSVRVVASFAANLDLNGAAV